MNQMDLNKHNINNFIWYMSYRAPYSLLSRVLDSPKFSNIKYLFIWTHQK